MKKYIIAVLASAGLVLGTNAVLMADPSDPNTTDQTGRAIDRSQVPSSSTNAYTPNSTDNTPSVDQRGRAADRNQVPSSDTTGAAYQQPSTTQNLPDQSLPGRALDRAIVAGQNPATGFPEVAGSESSAATMGLASNPSKFVIKAYAADQEEIRMSQIAQEKSSSDQVKSLAQTIVQDHQAHAAKVQQLAQQKGIAVSDQLSPECQKSLDAMSAMSGPAFDRHYLHDMVRDHKKAIALYDQAAANNSDPDVRALAQSTLPTLKEHLQMAQRDATIINEPAGANRDK
jgi:putative membrane protein